MQEGNALSFESFVREYEKYVYRVALRNLHCKEDAEDITQEVFKAAWRHICNFRGESRLSTWLFIITIRKCNNLLAGRTREVESIAGLERGLLQSVDNNPYTNTLKNEHAERLAFALKRFDVRTRQVLEYVLDGLGETEIAERIGKSVTSARAIRSRAIAKLRNSVFSPWAVQRQKGL